MKNKFGLKINNLSLNLFISYLSILIFPFLAILVIYFASSSFLLSVQKERLGSTLRQTAEKVDRGLTEAGNTGSYIAGLRALKDLGRHTETGKSEFFDFFVFKQTLPDYSGMNSMIDSVYLFFNKGRWMIKNYSVVPADERAYLSVGRISAENYEILAERLSGKYYGKNILYGETEKDGEYRMMVLHSFPFSSFGKPYGTIVITLNEELIKKELESNLIEGNAGLALIIDREGKIRRWLAGKEIDFTEEELNLAEILKEETDEIRIKGKSYIVVKTGNTINKDTYAILLPKHLVLGQIGNIKYLIILLSLASVAMGLAACVILWRKRRRTVLAFSEYWDKFGISEIELNSKNIFWEGLPKVLNRAADLQASLLLQKNFIKTAVIRKLLLGEYQEEKDLPKEIKEISLDFSGKRYYSAVLSVKGDINSLPENRNELRLILGDYIRENLGLGSNFCEIDYYTTGFILPVKDDPALLRIRELFSEFQNRLKEEKHLETYIGIGRSVNNLLAIGTSFEEAMEVMEYLKFHDIRMVTVKDEIPTYKDSFFFPIETELLLVKSIKMANKEEVADVFRVLEYENYTFRTLSGKMRHLLLEFVRATVIRALKDEEGRENYIESLQSSESLTEIHLVLEELFRSPQVEKESRQTEERTERKEELSEKILKRMSEPDFNLAVLAEECSVSESKLYKEFKEIFGISFSEYLENERIKKACELLRENIQVKEIANLTGYSSDISFRRAFKRVIGLAPSYYAKGLSEEKK